MKKIISILLSITFVISLLIGQLNSLAASPFVSETWANYLTNTEFVSASDEDDGTRIAFSWGYDNGTSCSTPIDPKNFKFRIESMLLPYKIGNSYVEYKFLDTSSDTVVTAKGFGIRLKWIEASIYRADLVVYDGSNPSGISINGTNHKGYLNEMIDIDVSFDKLSGTMIFGQVNLTAQASNLSFILPNSFFGSNAFLHVKYTNVIANCFTTFSRFGLAYYVGTAQIISNEYKVDSKNGLITGIKEETKATELKSKILNSLQQIKTLDKNGTENFYDNIGTGMAVELCDGENVIQSLTVVVKGDIDGNGLINLNDLISVRNDLLDSSKLEGVYKTAGDLYNEGNISLNDLVGIMAAVSESGAIRQN